MICDANIEGKCTQGEGRRERRTYCSFRDEKNMCKNKEDTLGEWIQAERLYHGK